jgi:hypothetical protein
MTPNLARPLTMARATTPRCLVGVPTNAATAMYVRSLWIVGSVDDRKADGRTVGSLLGCHRAALSDRPLGEGVGGTLRVQSGQEIELLVGPPDQIVESYGRRERHLQCLP